VTDQNVIHLRMKYRGANVGGYKRDLYLLAEYGVVEPERYDHEFECEVDDLAQAYQTTCEIIRHDVALAWSGTL